MEVEQKEIDRIHWRLPTGGNPYSASGKVIRTLPVYPYPMVPKFSGKGNINDGSNYVSVRTSTMSRDDFKWLGQGLF
jgi:feruloyl esterase